MPFFYTIHLQSYWRLSLCNTRSMNTSINWLLGYLSAMRLHQILLCCCILFSKDEGLITYWYNPPNMQRFSLLHNRVICRIFQYMMPLIHIRILPGCRYCIDWSPITISSSASAYNFTRYGMDRGIYVFCRRSANTEWRFVSNYGTFTNIILL